MALEVDPANQTTGILKLGTGIVAGFLMSKFKMDPTTAGGLAGDILGLVSIVWQIIHRMKTQRAIKAAADLPSTASPATVEKVVKAA